MQKLVKQSDRSSSLQSVLLCACAAFFALAALAHGQQNLEQWRLSNGDVIEATFSYMAEGTVFLKDAEGKSRTVAYEDFTRDGKLRAVAADDTPLPLGDPPWLPGYKVRIPLRVQGNMLTSEQNTIIAKVPTGGWLKDDLSDLWVTTASGRVIPCVVLSHDPLGDTLIQFRKMGPDRWYWVYIHNPDAPDADKELAAKLENMKKGAQTAVLTKMASQKTAAQRAGEYRDLSAAVQRHRNTVAAATKELADWAKLLPDRKTAAETTSAAVPPLEEAAKVANEAHAPLKKVADEATAKATKLRREAVAATQAATAAGNAIVKAEKDLEAAKAAVEEAAKAFADAEAALAKGPSTVVPATAAADATEEEKKKADAAIKTAEAARAKEQAALEAKVKAATEAKAAAEADVPVKAAAIETAKAAKVEADKVVTEKEALAAPAEEEAKAARLAAAPTGTAKAEADKKLAAAKAASLKAGAQLKEANERIAAATKLKNDNEAALKKLEPQIEPAKKAADKTKAAAEAAVVDAAKKDQELFDLAAEIDPRLYKEGLTAQFREWAGDNLSDWANVVAGLTASENILGSAMVDNVLQNSNPFRLSDPLNFATSYRGYMKIEEPGVYSFFVNGDDTAFLFVNGYRVYSRTGTNKPIRGKVPLYSIGADIMLEKGVHQFEVHHIVGNTPNAIGLAALMWLKPGAGNWSFVPSETFVKSMMAVPVGAESPGGKPVAVFEWGMDDSLTADGITAYICDFQAVGKFGNAESLVWDFGDGVTGKGARRSHVYFSQGDKVVSLKSRNDLPAFKRRCHVYVPPTDTNPHSLAKAVKALDAMELSQLDRTQLNDAFVFLRICQQPSRWPVMEKLATHMLKLDGLDLEFRMLLRIWLMEAVAQQGRADESLKMVDAGIKDVGEIRTLKARIKLKAANIFRDFLKDYQSAGQLYVEIIQENRRLRHPVVREAAVAWGDMYLDAGSQAEAAEAYRLANDLGTVGLVPADDPVKRGALLRVAEQQLKGGNVQQTQRLLERIEIEFPEQKLEGLYRYLRGEARRTAGLYEQAIRDYEVLLKLRQWAGYRAHAVFGIADSYYRMGDLEKAQNWLSALQESYPHHLESIGQADYPKYLEQRIKTFEKLGGTPELFKVYHTSFEPNETNLPVRTPGLDILPSTGIDGPYTAQLDAFGTEANQILRVNLNNLPTQGMLFVDFWYRDRDTPAGRGDQRGIVISSRDVSENQVDKAEFYPDRTYGQWAHAGVLLNMPATAEGGVTLSMMLDEGLLEIDGVTVRHISDAEMHSLRSFIEGADPQ